MEQHQIEPAIQAYQTALALKPGEPDILNNLEIALAAQKIRSVSPSFL